jgi:hypothetical protein
VIAKSSRSLRHARTASPRRRSAIARVRLDRVAIISTRQCDLPNSRQEKFRDFVGNYRPDNSPFPNFNEISFGMLGVRRNCLIRSITTCRSALYFFGRWIRRSAHLIRQSAEVLPSFNPANPRIWFVIDGQQRLSVLFQAFEGQVRENDAGRSIDFGRLCFVVDPDLGQENPRRIVYWKPLHNEFVPLRDILAADWRPRMPTKAQWFLKKIKECRLRLLDYPVPVIVVTCWPPSLRSSTITRGSRAVSTQPRFVSGFGLQVSRSATVAVDIIGTLLLMLGSSKILRVVAVGGLVFATTLNRAWISKVQNTHHDRHVLGPSSACWLHARRSTLRMANQYR